MLVVEVSPCGGRLFVEVDLTDVVVLLQQVPFTVRVHLDGCLSTLIDRAS